MLFNEGYAPLGQMEPEYFFVRFLCESHLMT